MNSSKLLPFSLPFNETTFSAITMRTVLPAEEKMQLQDFSPISLTSFKYRQKYNLIVRIEGTVIVRAEQISTMNVPPTCFVDA